MWSAREEVKYHLSSRILFRVCIASTTNSALQCDLKSTRGKETSIRCSIVIHIINSVYRVLYSKHYSRVRMQPENLKQRSITQESVHSDSFICATHCKMLWSDLSKPHFLEVAKRCSWIRYTTLFWWLIQSVVFVFVLLFRLKIEFVLKQRLEIIENLSRYSHVICTAQLLITSFSHTNDNILYNK